MNRRDLLKKFGIGAATLPMVQVVTSLAKAEDNSGIVKAEQDGLVSKKTVSSALGFDQASYRHAKAYCRIASHLHANKV